MYTITNVLKNKKQNLFEIPVYDIREINLFSLCRFLIIFYFFTGSKSFDQESSEEKMLDNLRSILGNNNDK